MPYVRPAAAKVAELSWDAFAAPTPEAEGWQPDPDSVPVAGYLPDPRFNKDPLTERQKQALKRDQRLGLTFDVVDESPSANSNASSVSKSSTPTGIGGWLAAAPRRTKYPRALAPSVQHPLFSPSEPHKPVKAASAAPLDSLGLNVASRSPESSTKTRTPAWAEPLAHLLGDTSPKELPSEFAPPSQPLPTQAAAPPSSVSRPPHLRKQLQLHSSSVAPAATSESCLDSLEEIDVPTVKAQHRPSFMAPSLDITCRTQDTSAATRLESMEVIEERKVQKCLLESFISKKPASSSQGHERYLQAKLIQVMEDDFDMPGRTTRRELNRMSEKEFEAHFTKTKSMHELKWDNLQRRDRIGMMNLKASLATFQQQQESQFERSNFSTGSRFSAG